MSFLQKILKVFKSKSSTRFPGVVVGQIKNIDTHPNADKLRVVKVDAGKEITVVCGANNICVGQLVPTAMIGAALPGGIVIQQANIRGVDSEGMLCSATELCVGEDDTGILILEQGEIGEPIDAYILRQ